MSDQSIKTKIQEDLVQFMKAGEKDKVDVIRFVLSFINAEEKDKQKSLTDSETLQVLKKGIKRNQESFQQFSKASRNDLAEKEKKDTIFLSMEKKIILAFPTKLSKLTYPTLLKYLLSLEQSLLSPIKK